MKGLELSRRYYETYGKAVLAQFPALKTEFAVGLVGRGSECFGFDDELSRDHDYGPSFCIWLRKEVYEQYAGQVQAAYDEMPREFMGYPARRIEETGQGRIGVLCLEDFYYGILGMDHVPCSNREWLALQDENLATAINGEVFEDRLGLFSRIREGLSAYYPEDVRIKKIVARMAKAARAGQYNYARAMRRGERVAAELALQEFVRESMSLVYLLNRRYAPFDKWIHRGMKQLPSCAEIGDMLGLLYQVEKPESAWDAEQCAQNGALWDMGGLNMQDGRVLIIEAVCNVIVQELNAQGLSDMTDNFLQNHLGKVTAKIQDEDLKKMQFLEG
ncbi:MAG: DUF4037 domain-containing protein [Blautia sp.]|nr:DUF4037 domain-containing protein [Lachnoclostridium sp.]MCM1210911.1 DUF4037 domain-containing protein [Blautia sp.]